MRPEIKAVIDSVELSPNVWFVDKSCNISVTDRQALAVLTDTCDQKIIHCLPDKSPDCIIMWFGVTGELRFAAVTVSVVGRGTSVELTAKETKYFKNKMMDLLGRCSTRHQQTTLDAIRKTFL